MDFNTWDGTKDGDMVVQLPCNPTHIFHRDCLKEWVTYQYKCPICREKMLEDRDDSERIKNLEVIIRRNNLIVLQNDDENLN